MRQTPEGLTATVVVPLQIHRDLGRAEVIVLPEIQDLADDLGFGGMWTDERSAGAVAKAVEAELLVTAEPAVVRMPGDAEVAAGHGNVAGDLLGVTNDR